jgi:hypothetical protein
MTSVHSIFQPTVGSIAADMRRIAARHHGPKPVGRYRNEVANKQPFVDDLVTPKGLAGAAGADVRLNSPTGVFGRD